MEPLAVIFPGQGSQAVGMLAETAKKFSTVISTFAEASEVLEYNLWDLVQDGPAEKLNMTTYTQPALLAASHALWLIMREEKIALNPIVLAGHSLGEYNALLAAKAISFSDAIRLVKIRGEYMQKSVPAGTGSLAVIVGLTNSTVKEICEQTAENDEVLSPANFNSPLQTVVSGHTKAIKRAIIKAKEKGAKLARILPVSVPSHCKLMTKAADNFTEILDSVNFSDPEIPVINNVDVANYTSPESIKDGLKRQLYSPVRWVETIKSCQHLGATNFFECGPGKILTGLGKRIDSNLNWLPSSEFIK